MSLNAPSRLRVILAVQCGLCARGNTLPACCSRHHPNHATLWLVSRSTSGMSFNVGWKEQGISRSGAFVFTPFHSLRKVKALVRPHKLPAKHFRDAIPFGSATIPVMGRLRLQLVLNMANEL